MNNAVSNKIELISAPQNWEVIQNVNGKADITVLGRFVVDENDDTQQTLSFDKERLLTRVVDESDSSVVAYAKYPTIDGDRFSVTVTGVPCGGPYTLDFVMPITETGDIHSVKGERRYHFCVGDVFVVAGQSNAAGMGKDIVEDAPEIGVHVMRNLERWDMASYPFNDSDYSKHGMHLAFAKKLKKELGYPIGIIPGAMGGAPLSRWLKNEDGDLYAKLMNAIKKNKIGIKSVLWYQGCTDAGDGVSMDDYISRFETLVSDFRYDFSNDELAFFTFQLNRIKTTDEMAFLGENYDKIREAQRRAAQKIPGVYILPTIDATHMSDFIHMSSASYNVMGHRMALQVLRSLYNRKNIIINAPEIKSATIADKNRVILEFDNVSDMLYDFNAPLSAYPITLDDNLGEVALKERVISENRIEITATRNFEGTLIIGGQRGTDPKNIIIDYGTQLPMLCFCDFVATK